MKALHRTALGVLIGASTILGTSGVALAAPQGVGASNGNASAVGQRNGQGLGLMPGAALGAGMKRGMRMNGEGTPLENLRERVSTMDFSAAGVTKPAFWDSFVTWLSSDDATKVAESMKTQHEALRASGERPAMGQMGAMGPLAILSKIDFAAAGVSEPSFWGDLETWSTSDDAKKLFDAQMTLRAGERFKNLSTELEKVDFNAAGISKPAFWGDLVTWLKGSDASKLATHLAKVRRAAMPSATN